MAYKVFTNGSPLPASDLNTYLMNQSVMTFANSTARTATLTTPTEGMTTYLEDTNKVQVYDGASWVDVGGVPITTQGDLVIGNSSGIAARLAIGANGTILQSNGTTASWQTVAAPGESWVSISTGSITTGVGTFSLTSLASYEKYLFLVRDFSGATASAAVRFRINNDSAGNYKYANNQVQAASTYAAANFDPLSSFTNTFVPGGSISSNAASQYMAAFFVSGCKSSGGKFFRITGAADAAAGNGHISVSGSGIWNNSAVVNRLDLILSTGNIDAGTYELWGSN